MYARGAGKQLVHLDLGQNRIGFEGAKALFEALKKSAHLISLNIGNKDTQNRNTIGPKGCRYLKELLEANEIIQILNVRGNSLTDQGCH